MSPGPGLDSYFRESRRVSTSLFFVGLLAIAHAVAVATADPPTLNAAESALARLLWWCDPSVRWVSAVGAVGFAAAWAGLRRTATPIWRFALPLLTESLLYAVLLGPLVGWMLGGWALSAPAGPRDAGAAAGILASVGAGLYEEVLFRFGLMGGLYAVLQTVTGRARALVFSLVVSALVFAAYHHVGPGADPPEPWIVGYRFLAGILLGALFAWRGLAVVVYAHAFYDVLHELGRLAV